MSGALRLDSHLIPAAHLNFQEALPRIDAAICYNFRHRQWSRHDRDEAFAEARAATWVSWHSLLRRGRDPDRVGIAVIVEFACRGVKNGRTVGANRNLGRNAGDVYHPRVRRATGLRVVALDDLRNPHARSWQDWLSTADRHFGPADEAILRIDFAAWLETLPGRKRQSAELLAMGMTTRQVAAQLQVTPAAVSQDRLWLAHSWREFHKQLDAID